MFRRANFRLFYPLETPIPTGLAGIATISLEMRLDKKISNSNSFLSKLSNVSNRLEIGLKLRKL